MTHDVQEALMLATRVIVLSPRPATVAADLTVDLPYPRHRDNPALQALRADVLSRLGFAG